MEKQAEKQETGGIPEMINLEFKLIPEDLFDIYVERIQDEEDDPGMKLTTIKKSLKAKITREDLGYLPELIKYKIEGYFELYEGSDEEEEPCIIVRNIY